MPQLLAGTRTEPPVSVPSAKSTRPQATADAERYARLALSHAEQISPVNKAVLAEHLALVGHALKQQNRCRDAEPFLRRSVALYLEAVPDGDVLQGE